MAGGKIFVWKVKCCIYVGNKDEGCLLALFIYDRTANAQDAALTMIRLVNEKTGARPK